MDKIKRPKRDLSIPKSLMRYVAVFALLALILSATTATICNNAANNIRSSYPVSGEKYYLTNEQGEQLGNGTYIGDILVPFSERDNHILAFLELFPIIAAPVYSAFCIMAAAFLFYRNKLKKPLTELRTASEKIADNNLDFSIEYDSKDELGQLCASFEIMRATLAKTLSETWRQVEERKQLNAAFAHDLRTPLTVLKGYNEMLQESAYIQTKETAVTMGKHIARMESYVNSMSKLQRLEDTQPEYKLISLQPFLFSLQESAEIICTQNKKTLYLHNKTTASQLCIDTEFVSQVCNNLIANAARYARTSVTLSFILKDNGFLLLVSDDGKGFDKDSLHKAVNPYFTQETDHAEHFGLGLYICRLLCERHSGYLHLENRSEGAEVSAFFKTSAM